MGGLEREKYSLLSVYLMATDDKFNVIGDLYLYLKPDDGIYISPPLASMNDSSTL
jgi:hypothetical protein